MLYLIESNKNVIMKSFIGFVPILASSEFDRNTEIFEINEIAILCFGLFNVGYIKDAIGEPGVKICPLRTVQKTERIKRKTI